ncbi:MAG TPA: chromate transporter [Candidatus Pullilachnospira intestinigallinarum]|nr:chromate transporter [Candidatus Pullilachnospira intestinigallinarum]
MIYLELFLSFLQIGAFSFGGGYAAMPLIQHQVVELHGWLSLGEFTDLVTISQMTPGPIAINSATFVGTKIAGIGGAVAATLGCILPSCILVSLIAWVYLKYRSMRMLQGVLKTLRPAVVAMIAAAGMLIIVSSFFGEGNPVSLQTFHITEAVIFAGALALLRWKKMNPILVMVLCGAAQVAVGLAEKTIG